MTRPNILFLFSDQQRWDTLGCYGQPLDLTPNLDRMAAEGVRFEHAFTCQPVCGPARACLMTGQYATQTGCFRNGIALPLDQPTTASLLSEAGYETAYIGKWHLASTIAAYDEYGSEAESYDDAPIPPHRRGGFRDFWLAADLLEFTSHSYDGHVYNGDMQRVDFPEGRFRADVLTDWAIEYLQNRQREKPFFLVVSYLEPHHQNDHNRYEGPAGSAERFRDFVVPGDLEGTEGDWREQYPDYLGCVHSLDENVGRILAALETLGWRENTLVIYTSDHGSHFCTRNGEYKRSCHEASVRIPLIASGPGFADGPVAEQLVSLIDFPPTILAAAGVEPPTEMSGRPLQSLLNGSNPEWPAEVFIQISENQVGRALRTPRWKYAVHAPDKHGWHDPASDRYVEQFLYDLQTDPHERHNLVNDPAYADVRAELAERLKAGMVAAGETLPDILPAK